MKVVIDKKNDILGEADLNLIDYGDGEYKILKLQLKKCADPDAYVEVGLRGTAGKEKGLDTSRSHRPSVADAAQKDQIVVLL